MSLNSIRLSQRQVADLYPETLVLTADNYKVDIPAKQDPIPDEPTASRPASPVQPETSIQFLGRNNRNLVILVSYPDILHISESSLEFLSFVLKACQLTLADVAIVNMARQNLTSSNCKRTGSPPPGVLWAAWSGGGFTSRMPYPDPTTNAGFPDDDSPSSGRTESANRSCEAFEKTIVGRIKNHAGYTGLNKQLWN